MLRTMECSGPWNAQGRGMFRVEGCSGLRGTEGCGMLRTGMLKAMTCPGPWDVPTADPAVSSGDTLTLPSLPGLSCQ